MTGHIHAFDARVGGGYRMSLFYPPSDGTTGELALRGKTTDLKDRVNVRFVELVPAHRIVEAFTFNTADPALQGRNDDHSDVREADELNRGHTPMHESASWSSARRTMRPALDCHWSS